MAAPLKALTSVKKPFRWSPAADGAFQVLKKRFCCYFILQMPDPALQFVVEVHPSDVGVGEILSQRAVADQKLYPSAALSRRLFPTKRNYDIGNHDLPPVKLALEEWRHWLKGGKHQFLVWTDHKNLEDISGAKKLNLRQAWCALFFTRFNFSLSATTQDPGTASQMPCPGSVRRMSTKRESLDPSFV